MAEPFMGEIRLMSFNYPPKDWAICNGQLLPINQNQALFSLLGTTYGGDGRQNFALPDLRGRVALHMGNGFNLGERAGQESHTITQSEMPAHNHFVQVYDRQADSAATATPPSPTTFLARANAVPSGGGTVGVQRYSTAAPSASLAAGTLSSVGGSQAHENRQPYLVVEFCIALYGIFPSQN